MSPRIFPVAMSITATALIPPQAANSVTPSGETCKAVGAMPRTVWEKGWIGIVRATRMRSVSITEILSPLPLATYSRRRGSSRASAVGCSPTASV
jgi:hypothetical protein